MLIEVLAHFDNVENATTAATKTSDNKHIQITTFSAPALRRSSPASASTAEMAQRFFASPKSSLRTQEDLDLICVDTDGCSLSGACYLYQADDGWVREAVAHAPAAGPRRPPCWVVTRKIRITTQTRVKVLNTFRYKVRVQRDRDSLCE
jgi:hypothetical protein